MRQQILADSAAQAFVMLNARRYEPGADPVEDEGYYDDECCHPHRRAS